ncbi:hypothetical protein NDA11_002158 [Ustilago hordei]|uniref:SET domain-containing protein n=1 Tax=Ustilago hordei TaxID=120017 RepID=I2FUT2_USTHO|nr:uncharacterized protein UHO2_07271 [Ustilago hordei]KAJ1040786.1 hypothetical protein NDA10_006778 [Ustilago hordei]KAJ1576488.1 hypothetical protein NDA12_005760 [Ustilago hordei]KAJ1577750.1 hypothetical protein NDA15_002007 [Ustilago hordei]KAJ1596464.1 hypothetical protein NDA11_002158 [Ustilago hordei]CCF50675.1 uncharacterized protein UHOR_06216 [Ustilago hordei]
MSEAQALQAAEVVNSAVNGAVPSTRSPAPCPKSALNSQAREWWTRAPSSSKQGRGLLEASLQVPKHWPEDVIFITQNLVAPSVPESVARRYVLQPSSWSIRDDSDDAAGPSIDKDLPQATHRDGRAVTLYTTSIQEQVPLAIMKIYQDSPWCSDSFHSTSRNLKAHPSLGSFGLFAAQEILPNTFIRPYLGVLHTKADADFHSTYDLSLCHDPRLLCLQPPQTNLDTLSLHAESVSEQQDPSALYIDSRYWGNESRFVNDYRGIAQKPNVEFRSFIQYDSTAEQPQEDSQERFQMGLFATRLIRKGQELVINYGKSYWVHHDQLDKLKKAKAEPAKSQQQQQQQSADPPTKAPALDPLQAMLQRSRMRVSRTAPIQRPPQQPPSRTP